MDSRTLEHLNGQDKDIARRGTVAKRGGPVPIHPGMAGSKTRGMVVPASYGATINPPDASSPLPTDPSRAGKAFPLPQVTFGTPARVAKMHDPNLAAAILNEAKRSPDDFARDLHTALPDKPSNK